MQVKIKVTEMQKLISLSRKTDLHFSVFFGKMARKLQKA